VSVRFNLRRPKVQAPGRLRKLGLTVLIGVVAVALLVFGGVFGSRPASPAQMSTVVKPAGDRLADSIARAQQRLRELPGDWRTWAALGSAYLEQGRVTADPTYYPKAEGAARRSLEIHPDGNADALVALGTLAAARHDFTGARDQALAAIAINGYDAAAYGVLTDARTQLGDAAGATDAVQHMLDLRPGLAAYARGSYDLEQRGRVTEAVDLMRRALDSAVDPHDIAFCRVQLGDLAWQTGDLAGATREFDAALAADPTSIAGQRGRARAAAAAGQVVPALASYAEVTRRSPTPGYLLEYAELLRAAGRTADADAQLQLAGVAQRLFTDNGGIDGLTGAALAIATGDVAEAVRQAQSEWDRRQFADVADMLGWTLHLAGRDGDALPLAQRAAATGARSASYAYHLGAIELALGQRDAARADLGRAIATNPHFSPLDAPQAQRLLAGVSG
jgi:tetratricopeptide (TPR) repeat protein